MRNFANMKNENRVDLRENFRAFVSLLKIVYEDVQKPQ